MYAQDFEYDGQYLSDYGFMICEFDGGSGVATVSAGSKITFNTVSQHGGRKHSLTSAKYDEGIQLPLNICKDPCKYDDLKITDDEFRDLMRWLNRKEFLKLRFMDEDDKDRDICYYNASFNVQKITIAEVLYGLELTATTDSPFGYGKEQSVDFSLSANESYTLIDLSDEIGYIYPTMQITCGESGTLQLYNEMEDCTMIIKNCQEDEIISIDGDTHIIQTSRDDHDISNDFNYEFFRIGNKMNDRRNRIESTLSCDIIITYCPIIKSTP